ncbi:MAG: site-2 protease family protein, partial [Gammaproteobacteria bacterium]
LRVSAAYRPTTRGENLTLWICGGVFCAILIAGLLNNYVPQKLSVPFFVVLWGLMLVLHELGHALMARALGWRVAEMSIGFGPMLWRGSIGGTHVMLRLIPIEGYVLPGPTDARGARLKSALIFAAGPGIEIALLVLLVLWLGTDTVFNQSDQPALIALKTLAIVIIWGAGFNLLPFRVGDGVSDGLGIFLSGFMTDETVEQRVLFLDEREAMRLAQSGDTDAALARLANLNRTATQEDRLQRLRIELLSRSGRYTQARRELDAVIGQTPIVELTDVNLLHQEALVEMRAPHDAAIRTDLALNRARRLAPADSPMTAQLAITRGIASVRQQRSARGGDELAAAYMLAPDQEDRARALGYLALAAERCHDAEAAQRFTAAFEHINEDRLLAREIAALRGATSAR